MTNNLKQNGVGEENGIIEIKNKSTKNICENITKEKIWMRSCPDCGNTIEYKDKWYYTDSLKKNRFCRKCSRKGMKSVWFGKHHTEETKKKLSISNKGKNKYWLGKNLSEETKEKIRNNKFGIKMSEETKQKISKVNMGNQYRKGFKHSEKSKIKMRAIAVSRIKQIKGIICPNYNEDACEYFRWLNMWNGWNGKYALNGGEYYIPKLGYWPDYYDLYQNVIIEWDEPKHYKNGNLSENDIIRMNRIKEYLKCRFFRINSKTKEIKEF